MNISREQFYVQNSLARGVYLWIDQRCELLNLKQFKALPAGINFVVDGVGVPYKTVKNAITTD